MRDDLEASESFMKKSFCQSGLHYYRIDYGIVDYADYSWRAGGCSSPERYQLC